MPELAATVNLIIIDAELIVVNFLLAIMKKKTF